MTPANPSPPAPPRLSATLRVSDADAAFLALADTVYFDGVPLVRRMVDGRIDWVGEWPAPVETDSFPPDEET